MKSKDFAKNLLLILYCILLTIVICLFIDNQKRQQEDRIMQQPRAQVEEPQKMTGKWQIIMFRSGIFPPRVIKTDCYYVKDKTIWYRDMTTGAELPLPEGDQIVPDDGRDLEQYGVYKIEQPEL